MGKNTTIDKNDLKITLVASILLIIYIMVAPLLLNVSSLLYAVITAMLFFNNSFKDLAVWLYVNRDKFKNLNKN